jgi:hypothetical protein
MSTMVSARRSSFGMRCALCSNALIAPEWIEERNERQIHVWRCWKCDFYFETFTMIGASTTGDDTFPPRLVA